MSIRDFEGKTPRIPASVYVDSSALVIGDVNMGEDVSIWPMSVLRGDIHTITIGARSNIQDASVLHVSHDSRFAPGGYPLDVGADVTVGHRVILHGCRIGDHCLIGMASTIMDGAVLEPEVMLGAGSLVTPGQSLEGGHLWLGSPARRIRPLSEQEMEYLRYSASLYVKVKDRHFRDRDHDAEIK